VLTHRCDLGSLAVPATAAPLLEALWHGIESTAALAATSGHEREHIVAFVDQLARVGLLHAPAAPSVRAPASTTGRAPADLATRPFVRSEQLRAAAGTLRARRGYSARVSSAS